MPIFSPPNSTSISLLEGESQTGLRKLGKVLKAKLWSTRGVCFKAGVRSSGQRGQAGLGWLGWAGEGASSQSGFFLLQQPALLSH